MFFLTTNGWRPGSGVYLMARVEERPRAQIRIRDRYPAGMPAKTGDEIQAWVSHLTLDKKMPAGGTHGAPPAGFDIHSA